MKSERKFYWRPIGAKIEARINAVMGAWLGTPYMAGQQVRGLGVDCVQLVGGVLDDLYRSPSPTPIPRLRGDSGIHSLRAGFSTIHAIRQAYKSSVVRDDTIEPGDILITRATADFRGPLRPGHAMVAAVRPGIVLHAVPGGDVHFTSIQSGPPIIRIYRALDKHRWI